MALALVTLGLGLGSVAFLPVTQFFINGFGWRRTWFFMAVIFMALTIPSALVFLRRQPEDMGLLPDGDPVTTDETESAKLLSIDEPVWSMHEALRTRAFWLLTASMMMGSFAMGGGVHRIPYWVERGFDPRVVSLCFSADAIGATVMIIFSGFLLNRFPARFVAAGAYAGFAVSLSLMLVASTTLHLVISTVLFGLGAGTFMVCQTFLWASYYGRVFLGTIRGVTLAPMLLGVALGTPTVGYIYDYTGSYELAWQIFIGIYLLASLVMLLAAPPKKSPLTADVNKLKNPGHQELA
jgi:predicted MFS family arabinose efflux permease